MPRLPSVRVLLSIAGLALLLPPLLVGWGAFRDAEVQVFVASDVVARAEQLDVLLRLAPALSAERSWSGAVVTSAVSMAALPPGLLDSVGVNFPASLRAARATVDELMGRGDATGTRAAIDDVRGGVDGGERMLAVVLEQYGRIVADIDAAIATDTIALVAASGELSAPAIGGSVRIAEAMSDLQVELAGQNLQWIQLKAPFLGFTVDDVRALGDSIARSDLYSARIDTLTAGARTTTAARWRSLRSAGSTAALRGVYDQTVQDLSGSAGVGTDAVEVSSLNPTIVLRLVTQVTEVSAMGDERTLAVSRVVERSLADVGSAAALAQADAEHARRRIALLIGAFVVLLAGGGVFVGVLIVRPVGRMAKTAQALRAGRLGTRMSETGPSELRVAAHAMNEAISALETVEAQATALAEERLDDPILSRPTIGKLGESLETAVARLSSSLEERDEFQRRLAYEAAHDGLTNLPNRNAILVNLQGAVARTRRSSTSLALLFVDLDGFKSVNDIHGHQIGDSVLRTIAHRLATTSREGDLAGRLGGDEFVVVAEPVDDIDDAVALSHRILAKVCEPITIRGVTVVPSACIGIGFDDGSELTADELLRDADLAVYQAKSRGKGQVEVCDEDLRQAMQDRSTLEEAIQAAIVADELRVHFQPVIATRSRHISSLEALVRWDRPGSGLLAPDSFIPVAERTDLIVDIDRCVLSRVVAQLATWTGHPVLGSVPIAVNISARHLCNGLLAAEVRSILEERGVDPKRLVLEVTETALLEDMVVAARELSRLRLLGVRIALDDFGTGYMSLAHLRGLPVDVLKIDQTFIAAIESVAEQSLIKLMVDIGHLLGTDVTAEGVETAAQAEMLTAFGSDNLQGFLFSRPIDADGIEALVEGRETFDPVDDPPAALAAPVPGS